MSVEFGDGFEGLGNRIGASISPDVLRNPATLDQDQNLNSSGSDSYSGDYPPDVPEDPDDYLGTINRLSEDNPEPDLVEDHEERGGVRRNADWESPKLDINRLWNGTYIDWDSMTLTIRDGQDKGDVRNLFEKPSSIYELITAFQRPGLFRLRRYFKPGYGNGSKIGGEARITISEGDFMEARRRLGLDNLSSSPTRQVGMSNSDVAELLRSGNYEIVPRGHGVQTNPAPIPQGGGDFNSVLMGFVTETLKDIRDDNRELRRSNEARRVNGDFDIEEIIQREIDKRIQPIAQNSDAFSQLRTGFKSFREISKEFRGIQDDLIGGAMVAGNPDPSDPMQTRAMQITEKVLDNPEGYANGLKTISDVVFEVTDRFGARKDEKKGRVPRKERSATHKKVADKLSGNAGE